MSQPASKQAMQVIDLALDDLDFESLASEERAALEADLGLTDDVLQTEVAAIHETLGALGHAAEPIQPSAQLRDRLLASVTPETRWDGFVSRLSQIFDLAGDRIREILRSPSEQWDRESFPGIADLLHFDPGPRVAFASDAGLVWLEPGITFPLHEHTGDEWQLILQGRAEELESGDIWEPGDIVHRPPGSKHRFRALGDEPFVFAVILHAPIELIDPPAGIPGLKPRPDSPV